MINVKKKKKLESVYLFSSKNLSTQIIVYNLKYGYMNDNLEAAPNNYSIPVLCDFSPITLGGF